MPISTWLPPARSIRTGLVLVAGTVLAHGAFLGVAEVRSHDYLSGGLMRLAALAVARSLKEAAWEALVVCGAVAAVLIPALFSLAYLLQPVPVDARRSVTRRVVAVTAGAPIAVTAALVLLGRAIPREAWRSLYEQLPTPFGLPSLAIKLTSAHAAWGLAAGVTAIVVSYVAFVVMITQAPLERMWAALDTRVARWCAGVLMGASLALWSLAAGGLHRPPSSRSLPHVVWITIDALRADHMGLYGYARNTTPFLDSASQAMLVFERAIAQESYTQASVPSYLTSVYPPRHRVLYDQPTIDVLDDRFHTVAELLKENGYDTAAYVFNPHLNATYNFDQGFDLYDDTPEGFDRRLPAFEGFETARKIVAKCSRFLDEDWTGGSLFLYLHYRDVHTPYVPPPEYADRFLPKGQPYALPSGRLISDPDCGLLHDASTNSVFVDLYDAEIAYTDAGISQLLGLLGNHGITPANTIFIVTADHGEEFLDPHPDDPGGLSHGRTLYEEQVRVPLLLGVPPTVPRPPERTKGRVKAPVALVDLVPTLLDLLGIHGLAEDQIQGVSLRRVIDGGERGLPVFSGGSHGRVAVWDDGKKLYLFDRNGHRQRRLNFVQPGTRSVPVDFAVQLFDLRADPRERRDLSAESPEAVRRLGGLLATYVGGVRPGGTSLKPDANTLEQLRALGYVH